MKEIKEYSYRVEFSFFDQILKSEKHFKNQMVFESINEKIKENQNMYNDGHHFIINLRDLDDRYKVLIKRIGESDIEIIQIDKSNNYGNLWGYRVCTFDSDKQKALLNEICHGNKYCYYDSLNREEPEEIKRLLQSKKKYIIENTVLSVDDILNHTDEENIKSFHRFINEPYNRVNKISEESVSNIYIHDCYNKLQQAVNEKTLLFKENGYEVHDVAITYDILIKYDVLKDNKHYEITTCNCRQLLNAYVVKDNMQNYAYYIK